MDGPGISSAYRRASSPLGQDEQLRPLLDHLLEPRQAEVEIPFLLGQLRLDLGYRYPHRRQDSKV